MIASLVLLAALALPRGEGPFQELTFPQALEKAKEQQKVVLVDFFTTWCGPCKRLDATTWKDERVVAWLAERSVALKIDAEEQELLATDYRIKSYPTLLFVRPDGSELGRVIGYRSADQFLADAADVLAGRVPKSRQLPDPAKELEAARNALAGHENDPRLRMDLGQALMESGQLEEALTHYLWCWDESLHHRPSFVGVRASFLLGYLRELSVLHPPTTDAIQHRRAALEEALRGSEELPKDALWSVVRDLDDLNARFFARPQDTLSIYDELQAEAGAEDPRVEMLRGNLIEQLVAIRRYQEAQQVKPGLVQRYRSGLAMRQRFHEQDEIRPELAGLIDPEHQLRREVEEGFAYFEAFAGTGSEKEALQIVALALEYHGRDTTYVGLLQRAERAGSQSLGSQLLARARQALEGETLQKVEQAGEWVQ
jgi:thiol-disulfide isomerase/thioredoxin